MAEIVLAVASSHSPQLSIDPQGWEALGALDRTNPRIPFDRLQAERARALGPALDPTAWRARHARCQAALDEIRRFLRDHPVDVLVVVGDDQGELWGPEEHPAFAIGCGEALWDVPIDPETVAPAYRPALWAWHGTEPEPVRGHPALARHLLKELTAEGFDLTQVSHQLPGRTLGHAFTFVRRRLEVPAHVPIIPVMVNAFFPPNLPTPARCWALGEALGRAVRAWPEELRVGLVASGGLSHFVVDEALDRMVLDAILEGRPDRLAALPGDALTSGTAEIRNWIAVAAALPETLRPELIDYVPVYRSEAGTGVGMGFVRWH
ncbi:MAG: protocatechuate 3,4-dioxygenase [Firmicutes bacterium]|nr:protocatechuate 3,4-dioxygenase [Alicyclobacillaceae bacterium]MCL6498314.1 protocatechuate 3,4-dioxygenase [Bacillota bacterium]